MEYRIAMKDRLIAVGCKSLVTIVEHAMTSRRLAQANVTKLDRQHHAQMGLNALILLLLKIAAGFIAKLIQAAARHLRQVQHHLPHLLRAMETCAQTEVKL